MNDTSATVKIRWSETIVRTVEAEVPVDQIPDSLIEVDEDTWTVVTGDVEGYAANDFLEALDMAGSATEVGTAVENRYIEEDVALIPPIMIAAPPVAAVEASHRFDEYAEEV